MNTLTFDILIGINNPENAVAYATMLGLDRADAIRWAEDLFPLMLFGDSVAAEVSALINDTIRAELDGESWARY